MPTPGVGEFGPDVGTHPGLLSFINRSRRGVVTKTPDDLVVPPTFPVQWKNIYIVDQDGGGDFTDIQSAIDAANPASSDDSWGILLTGGLYSLTSLTLKEHVHLSAFYQGGWANGSLRGVPVISVTTAAGTFCDSVDNVSITGIYFRSGGTTGITMFNLASGEDMEFHRCVINLRASGNHNITLAGNSQFHDSKIIGRSDGTSWLTISAAFSTAPPHRASFNNTYFYDLKATGSGHCIFRSCTIEKELDLPSNATDTGRITLVGCAISTEGSGTVRSTISGEFIGCKFHLRGISNGDDLSFDVVGPAYFDGCGFDMTATNSATIHLARITSTLNGPIDFDSCNFVARRTTLVGSELIRFTSGLTSSADNHGVSFTGCHFDGMQQASATPLAIFAADTITGFITVDLNGNTYRGVWGSITGLGTNIKLRGNDLRPTFVEYKKVSGAGATDAEIGLHDVASLTDPDDYTKIRFRIHPPAPRVQVTGSVGGEAIIDAHALLSAEASETLDTFADVDTTNLSAHTPDTGGSWTARNATITIVGNQANVAVNQTNALYTVSTGTADGYAHVTVTGDDSVDRGGVAFRWADMNNYWRLTKGTGSPSAVILLKRVASVETTVYTSQNWAGTGARVGVSFRGSKITVYVNGNPVFTTTDSALAANTGVGVYANTGNSSGLQLDNFRFLSSGLCDITVSSEGGQEEEPIDDTEDEAILEDVPIIHHQFGYVDISTALTGYRSQDTISVKINLDALTTATALYVHGILFRTINVVSVLPLTGSSTMDGHEDILIK